MRGKPRDLTGQRFGTLTVLCREYSPTSKHAKWICGCDCGATVSVRAENLYSGKTKTCGDFKVHGRYKPTNKVYTVGDVGICIISDSDYFWFDAVDLPFVLSRQWYRHSSGRAATNTKRGTGYYTRLILGVTDKNVVIDHINGDIRDNRRCNLRLCNVLDNSRHRVCRQIKGYYKLPHGKYCAKIQVEGKSVHLGCFETEEAAAEAYSKAAENIFGEFAPHEKVIYYPGHDYGRDR